MFFSTNPLNIVVRQVPWAGFTHRFIQSYRYSRIGTFMNSNGQCDNGPVIDDLDWRMSQPSLQLQTPSETVFPTCQVRVVRFHQSCCPPPSPPPPVSPRPCLHQLPPPLAPSSSPTSELSAHCWTSTWDLPSSVRTAGPQPGTFPAQCAPLDLNLGPSELSAHRWTSTWDLPSSVRTAGPQPGTFRAQCALDLTLGPSQLSAHRWTSTAR